MGTEQQKDFFTNADDRFQSQWCIVTAYHKIRFSTALGLSGVTLSTTHKKDHNTLNNHIPEPLLQRRNTFGLRLVQLLEQKMAQQTLCLT